MPFNKSLTKIPLKKFSSSLILLFMVLSVNKGFFQNLIAIVVVIFLSILFNYKKPVDKVILSFSIFLLFYSLLLVSFYNGNTYNDFHFDVSNLFYYCLFTASIIFLGMWKINDFNHMASILIIFLTLLFIVQNVAYLFSGTILDLNLLIFGQESRQLAAGISWPRFSTIFEEPSTFASIMLLLAFIVYRSKSNIILVYLALIVSVGTLSIISIALVSMFIIFLFIKRYFIIAGLLITLIFYNLYSYSEGLWEIMQYQTSIFIRLQLFDYLYSGLKSLDTLTGEGYFLNDSVLSAATDPNVTTGRIASINDLGSFVFIGLKFGVIGLFLYILLIVKRIKLSYYPWMILILFNKLALYHLFFYTIFLREENNFKKVE